jgi:hypothetical protein
MSNKTDQDLKIKSLELASNIVAKVGMFSNEELMKTANQIYDFLSKEDRLSFFKDISNDDLIILMYVYEHIDVIKKNKDILFSIK